MTFFEGSNYFHVLFIENKNYVHYIFGLMNIIMINVWLFNLWTYIFTLECLENTCVYHVIIFNTYKNINSLYVLFNNSILHLAFSSYKFLLQYFAIQIMLRCNLMINILQLGKFISNLFRYPLFLFYYVSLYIYI